MQSLFFSAHLLLEGGLMQTCENKEYPMEDNMKFPGHFYLKPGELYTGVSPAHVITILGSCVAVTMYHKQKNVAVMCHAMQPVCSNKASGCQDECCHKFKIVQCTITEMINQLRSMDVPKEGLEVKLFGGSTQFNISGEGREDKAIGRQNINAALDVLSVHGISLNVLEVGGDMGRKLIFDTNSGAVFLKRIGPFRTQKPNPAAPEAIGYRW